MAKRDITALEPYFLIVSVGKRWYSVQCNNCGYKSKVGIRSYNGKLSSGSLFKLLQHGMSCGKQ